MLINHPDIYNDASRRYDQYTVVNGKVVSVLKTRAFPLADFGTIG